MRKVLEVGIGSGRNLPFYRRDVEGVLGVDPSEALLALARPHTAWTHFPVQLRQAAAEDLPLDERAVDTVVMTWTLCSVADPVRTPRGLNTANPAIVGALADAVEYMNERNVPLNSTWRTNQYVVKNGEKIPIPGGPGGQGVFNVITAIENDNAQGQGTGNS